ncbi:MAG: hypothetical protein ACRDPC_27115 [Solirubrobacteraceae bacterium]
MNADGSHRVWLTTEPASLPNQSGAPRPAISDPRTPDGTFVRADADDHADLLWAIRGAGGNFGIVTAFELEAHEVGNVVFSAMAFDASATEALLPLLDIGPLVDQQAQLAPYPAIINDMPPDATAYAHRTQNFAVSAVGVTVSGLSERWDAEVHPHTDGLYISFDADQRPSVSTTPSPERRSRGSAT